MRFSKSAIPWRQSDYGTRLKWTRVQTTDSIFDPFTNRIRSFHEFSLKRKKISKRSNLIDLRDFDVIQRLFLFLFLLFSFLRSELCKEVRRFTCSFITFEFIDVFPLCFEFPLTLIYIHSFVQNSLEMKKQILIDILDKNVKA